MVLITGLTAGHGGPALAHVRDDAAGTITTMAGGVGGPAVATSVALRQPCGVSYYDGQATIADGFAVRSVDTANDWLTTPAGTADYGPAGNAAPATSATLQSCATATDHSGNLVIADEYNNTVRVVAAKTGTYYGQKMTAGDIYSVAGGGTNSLGNGVAATKASLGGLQGVAVDGAGNLVISDTQYEVVRVVAAKTGTYYGQKMTAEDIYTVAGDGTGGSAGNGGPATKAELSKPGGIAIDGAGDLLIADTGDYRIRVLAVKTGSYYGQKMTAEDIYTVAGDGTGGSAGNGGPATKAELVGPPGVTVDAAGNLVIADVTRVQVVPVKTGSYYGQKMTAEDIYTVAGDGTGGSAGNGGPATKAELAYAAGVAVDAAGNLLIADQDSNELRVVAAGTGTYYGQAMTAGDIYDAAGDGGNSLSGNGGPATAAEFWGPASLALDGAGDLLIADEPNSEVRMVPATSGTFFGQAMTAGDVYDVAGDRQVGYYGNGGPATEATLWGPDGVAVDTAGNLIIADRDNERIRVVPATSGTFYGQAMTAGDIYTVAGDGTAGYSGDGAPATSAELDNPAQVAVDSAGTLVIADYSGNRVRVVAATTGTYYGQAMTAGDIYTVAGDGTAGYSGDGAPAISAELDAPDGVTLDAAGNLVIGDSQNHRVRVVAATTGTYYGQAMTAGDIYTVAGDGTLGSSGDGGPATKAELGLPDGVSVDDAGNLIIADGREERVRVVAATTGTYYGQAMTAGDIYTVAGDGSYGYSGDGGPATSAELYGPAQVVVNGQGDLLIADFSNGRVRMVTP
jgi:secreted PhoX family phosphatase